MPNRCRQRKDGKTAPWGKKFQPYEKYLRDQQGEPVPGWGENVKCLPGWGRKDHPVWGTQFQFYKKGVVELVNPFSSGPTKYADNERLQAPAGKPMVVARQAMDVGELAKQKPLPPDPARPWMLECPMAK